MARAVMTEPRRGVMAEEAAPPVPMLRHIVDKRPERPDQGPADVALCGKPWDRLHVSAGPLCDECRAEFKRRHPAWPLPGGAA